MGYGIRRGIGREMVTRLARSWGHRLVEPADRHRFLTVLTMRVLPVAPFTLVNFFVGAARIRFRDFFLASVIGRIPGIVLLTLGGLQSRNVFSSTGRDRPRFVGTHTGPVATRLGAVSVKAPAHHKPGWPASFSHSDQLRWSPLIVSVQIGHSLGWEFSRYGFEELRMTLDR
jgi:hypothetical protein